METTRSRFARIFISPDERRLRAGWRILLHLVMFFAILTGISSLLNPLLSAPIVPSGFPSLFLIEILAVTTSVFLARIWFDRRSVISLGSAVDRQTALDLVFGILLTGVIFTLIYLVMQASGWLQLDPISRSSLPAARIAGSMLMGFLGFVFVGWSEELMFRGYWLQNMEDGLNLFWAVMISSPIFGILHLANPNATLAGGVGTAAAGFLLAYAYLRTRKLWLPVGIHIGWNFFEGNVFGFPVSGTENFRLIQPNLTGPEIITGGAFGPEAGLIILPFLLLMAAAIFFYTRGRVKAISPSSGVIAPTTP